jgi:hypothetical protein
VARPARAAAARCGCTLPAAALRAATQAATAAASAPAGRPGLTRAGVQTVTLAQVTATGAPIVELGA